jgi:arylformamidase
MPVPGDPELDLEAEYDNRARVPEHPAIGAAWQADAAAYRERHGGERDLPFGPSDRMKMDLFGDPQGPVAMFIHGGYWQARDRRDFSHLAAGLVERGVLVALPSYDLCPQVRVGDIVAQMREACAFLWRRLGRPLTVAGHSAGGHLAACMLGTDWPAYAADLPPALVRSASCLSGLFDLPPLVATSVNHALRMDEAEARALSPAFWPAPRGLVLDAIVGAEESGEYLRQSRLIAEAWAQGGARTRCEIVQGANHFTIVAPLADPDSAMTRRLAALTASAGDP